MSIETEMPNKKESHIISSEKTFNEENQKAEAAELNKQEFLNELGISLKSEEEMSEMSFSEVISYQKEMKNEIIKVQNNLPPKDFEASRGIFDEALAKVNIVKNQADFKKLKSEFNIVDKNKDDEDNHWKIVHVTKDGKIIRDKVNSRFSSISDSLYGPRKLKRKS